MLKVDELDKIGLLEKKKKSKTIGLSHSELVNIVLIDPKTGKKRIFKTKNIDLRKHTKNQRDLDI
jgi:hypothetical protein